MLEQDGSAWKNLGYLEGDHPIRCLSGFRARDGFDRLVCEGGDMHFGTYVGVIYSKSYHDDSQVELPLRIGGNLGGGTPAGGWCYQQEITSFEKLPSDAGLMVTVTQTTGQVPADQDSCDGTLRWSRRRP